MLEKVFNDDINNEFKCFLDVFSPIFWSNGFATDFLAHSQSRSCDHNPTI